MGLIPDKTEALYAELKKERKQPPVVILAAGDFLQYIYSVLVAKNYRKIRSRRLVHEISFTGIF